ncbi:PIN domain-containing protein [Sphingomonas sp. HH69]
MRLGSIFVFFPVLHLQAEASYRLLPELTPLHRALEAAVQAFHRGGNALASVPIPELFRLLYGVSGAREILPDVLEDLIERGRVHQIGTIGIDPSSLRIIDLAPGRGAGHKALKSASSTIDHNAAQTREIARFFDPVLEEIVDGATLVPDGNEARDFYVPAEPFLAHVPTNWVERELISELRDDVQLYSASPRLLGHGWRRVTAELVINDGELSVECGDPRQTDYLRGLSQRVRGSWLLPSSPDTTFDWSSQGGERLSVDLDLPDNLSRLVLTRDLSANALAGLALPPSVVHVVLDAVEQIAEPTLLAGTSERQTRQVAYPRTDNPGVSGIFSADGVQEYLRLPVTWNGLHADIGVYRPAPGFAQAGSRWSDVVEALETECQYSDSPEIAILPAFWLDPAEFWRRLYERPASTPGGNQWAIGIVNALEGLPPSILATLREGLPHDERLKRLRAVYPGLADLFPSSHAMISGHTAVSKDIAPVPLSCTRVITFDTSSFIENGELVASLRPTDFLVNPQVVAAEVERKKTDSAAFRIASRSNLRAIDELPRERWTAPFSDRSLLAPGDNRNNDGAIIAALIPYRQQGYEIVLVSEDHDFLLRCEPYGIHWMNAKSFLSASKSRKSRVN